MKVESGSKVYLSPLVELTMGHTMATHMSYLFPYCRQHMNG